MNVYNSDMLQKRLAPDLRLYAASNCGLASTQGSETLGLAAKVNTVKTLMYDDGPEKSTFAQASLFIFGQSSYLKALGLTSRIGSLSSPGLIHKPRCHFYYWCPCFGACLGGSNFPNSINS